MDGLEENVCLSTPIDLEDIEDLIDRKESSNETYPNERTKNRPNVLSSIQTFLNYNNFDDVPAIKQIAYRIKS